MKSKNTEESQKENIKHTELGGFHAAEEIIFSCPLCGSSAGDVLGRYRHSHPLFDNRWRAVCSNCEFVYVTPMPNELDLSAYNNNYFTEAHGRPPTGDYEEAFFTGIARLRKEYIDKYLKKNHMEVSSVFEMGPGLGYFAHAWLEACPNTKYWAAESDTTCHQQLRKIGVNIADQGERDNRIDPVNLVVMSHVLEHVSKPKEFIVGAISSLRRGGAIFIEVPCKDWEHKTLDEPHLLFFDKPTLKRLLEEIGLMDVEINYYGVELDKLKKNSIWRRKWNSLRSRLIQRGMVAPFSIKRAGMEKLSNPLERAVVAPFRAHVESTKPSWWLRAIAQKK